MSDSARLPTPARKRVAVSNAALWASTPVLPGQSGKQYLGRVFVEIWRDGTARAAATNSVFFSRALAALQMGSGIRYKETEPATAGPVLAGTNTGGSEFAGRVVVELWDAGQTVEVMGSDSELVQQAIKKISGVLTAP